GHESEGEKRDVVGTAELVDERPEIETRQDERDQSRREQKRKSPSPWRHRTSARGERGRPGPRGRIHGGPSSILSPLCPAKRQELQRCAACLDQAGHVIVVRIFPARDRALAFSPPVRVPAPAELPLSVPPEPFRDVACRTRRG